MYLADIVSGAMLKNIVDRAKTKAVKATIESERNMAMTPELLEQAIDDEYRETTDAILDVDPEQWSRINNLAGGHAVRLRSAAGGRR